MEVLCEIAGDAGLAAAGPCKAWSPSGLKSAGDGPPGGAPQFGFAGMDREAFFGLVCESLRLADGPKL